MKLSIFKIFFFVTLLIPCIAYADFFESFDNPAHYDPPNTGLPHRAHDVWDVFFPNHLGVENAPGQMGNAFYYPSHITRGAGKAFQMSVRGTYELIPVFAIIPNWTTNIRRIKFDLWIGPKTGIDRHDCDGLKFIHCGTTDAHVLHLTSIGGSETYYTNLATGGLGAKVTTENYTRLHFRQYDVGAGIFVTNNSEVVREVWNTWEIEIDFTNHHLKIWLNGVLDFYRDFPSSNWTTPGVFVLVNLSDSAGNRYFYGAIDNLYKYDSGRSGGDIEPPRPPTNLNIMN